MKQASILSFLQSQSREETPRQLNVHAGATVEKKGDAAVSINLLNENPDRAKHIFVDESIERQCSQHFSLTICLPSDPRVSISKVYPSHIGRIKSITSTLLPIRYSDHFFKDCLNPDRNSVICFVALYDSKPVGWIRSRVEPFPSAENHVYNQIYVEALGVLAPYRGLGLARALLMAAIDLGCQTYPTVRSIYAHVWETNEDALLWYNRQAFYRVMLQPQYYRRLRPAGAWVVRKDLT